MNFTLPIFSRTLCVPVEILIKEENYRVFACFFKIYFTFLIHCFCTGFMKLTILILSYLICHSYAHSQVSLKTSVTTIVKTYGWENVRSREYRQGGGMSYQRSLRRESVFVRGSTCRGTILRESANLGLGKCQSGNCLDTNLSAKLSLKNCFKQL